ncbi:MAG: C4-type zinc ribbon domain-containing protein [Chlamydiota bacterium]|nr:C4-type zinc ribbon domain-containing protein [Chlamydiota bacterium]
MNAKIKSFIRILEIEDELRKEAQTFHLELIQELATTRMGIPTDLIKVYDRVKKRYKNAFVRLHNGVCTGCHMAAPIGIAIVAKAARSIHTCDHCGRLIYIDLDPPVEAVKEEPKAAEPVKPRKARKKKS